MDVHEPATLDASTSHANAHESNGAPSLREFPRGLLPVPAAVQRLMDEEKREMTEAARKFIRDNYVLQYHVGGQYVLYQEVPEGVEVLAVGLDEVAKVRAEVPLDQRPGSVGGHIEEWGWD